MKSVNEEKNSDSVKSLSPRPAHSRRPWQAAGHAVFTCPPFGSLVARCHAGTSDTHREADAEFIVRAVNAHDALVKALRLMHDSYCWPNDDGIAAQRARAALALAEGDAPERDAETSAVGARS